MNLPPKFHTFREHQEGSIDRLVDFLSDPTPGALVLNAPTGSGKSITYMAALLKMREVNEKFRGVVLTGTKGLQQQLDDDFGEVEGFTEVRGMSNYKCLEDLALDGCHQGFCHDPNSRGLSCTRKLPYHDPGPDKVFTHVEDHKDPCLYYLRRYRACCRPIVSTNYAYWIAINRWGKGLGKFNALILDEAHEAEEWVHRMLEVQLRIDHAEVAGELADAYVPPIDAPLDEWQAWARAVYASVKEAIKQYYGEDAMENTSTKGKPLKSVLSAVQRLAFSVDESWARSNEPSRQWPAKIRFAPRELTKPYIDGLLLDIPKVVFVSATVTPQILTQFHYLNIGRKAQVTVPSTFPIRNRRVLHIPTVRLNYRTPKGDRIRVVQRMDEIIASRIGTKGIIHTVSFARADFIKEYSMFSECMMTYDGRTAQEAVDAFKQEKAPCILLAPSAATGFNFPDDECRWQIIAKVPYPSTADPIMRARVKASPGLSSRIAAQSLVQACGRGCRHRHDSCETFIVDDTIDFLIGKNRHLFPEWFLESYGRVKTIPEPQEELR